MARKKKEAKAQKVRTPEEHKKIARERKYVRDVLQEKVRDFINAEFEKAGMTDPDPMSKRYAAAQAAAEFTTEATL